MADISLFELNGAVKMRVKLPTYSEETISGQKNVTENLGYVSGGTSETAKIIINAFTNLYDTFELDNKNTTVTYNYDLRSYIVELLDEEFSIIAPDNTLWNFKVGSIDQIGTIFTKNYGYIKGSLTPEKGRLFDDLAKALINLTNNTVDLEQVDAIFKPYEE